MYFLKKQRGLRWMKDEFHHIRFQGRQAAQLK